MSIFRALVLRLLRVESSSPKLSCWVHKPPKVHTFSVIVGNIIQKSVKCIHSATAGLGFQLEGLSTTMAPKR